MRHLLRLISLRHLAQSPLRSVLTVLGVAVGVATMVGVTAINRSVLDAFRSTVDVVAGKTDLTVTGSLAGFDEGVLEQVRAVPGVTHVASGLAEFAPVVGSRGESLYIIGLDFLDDGFFRNITGLDRDVRRLADDLEFLNSTDRLLVSERFAREHGLKTGDSFELVTTHGAQRFYIHGLLEESGPIKAFGGSVGVMFLPSAQAAFGRGPRIDRVDVAVDPKADFEAVKAGISKAVGPGLDVERPSRRGATVEKMVLSFQMGLNLGSGIALMVGVFLVYNTVSIGVAQRRREIGALRALGTTRAKIRALFTLEAVVMGLIGTGLGLPLGVVVGRGALSVVSQSISSLYVQVNARDVNVRPLELGLGILLGVGGSAIAALWPSSRASRVQPVEALRRDLFSGQDVAKVRSWPVALGVGSLALVLPFCLLPPVMENLPLGGYLAVFLTIFGLTLVSPVVLRWLRRVYSPPGEWLLGISGRLAADNFARAPGRTAVPVSALAIGVAMTVCIASFIGSFQASADKWVEQSVPADLFITSSAKVGGVQNQSLAPGLGDELARLPGVSDVDRVRVFSHDVLGLRVMIISVDPEIPARKGRAVLLEGRAPTREERLSGHVTISENLSKRRDLHAGSTFQMATPTGLRTYTVAAVALDYTSDQGSIFMAREVFIAHFGDEQVDTFELYLTDLSKAEELRRSITERWGKQYNLYVLTNGELREEAKNLVEGAFSITYAMQAVAVLLALLGVINTLLAAVLDRTREVGLLRAVGAGRGHVIRLFTAEACLMGLTGGVLGVGMGTVMGLILIHVIGDQATGWTFPLVFPWKIAVQMVTVSTVCAILAGLYPARRAASLDVVEALAYE
ncbi:MAG TPA: FtsX-like permease family protein [Myxococcaceae bacterium]|nr:FtsX-like permease family protein [Myxococcaceae bacterium]